MLISLKLPPTTPPSDGIQVAEPAVMSALQSNLPPLIQLQLTGEQLCVCMSFVSGDFELV